MYYKEEMIGGQLCFTTRPDGQGKPISAEDLSTRLLQAEETSKKWYSILMNIHNSIHEVTN